MDIVTRRGCTRRRVGCPARPNVFKRGAVYLLSLTISYCFFSVAQAQDRATSSYDLSQADQVLAAADGKHFRLVVDRYWRENNNAHSYSLIIISHQSAKSRREIVLVEDENRSLADFVVDAPGADCFSKKAVLIADKSVTKLVLLQNSFMTPDVTRAAVSVLKYDNQGIPGFPSLIFTFLQSKNLKRLCSMTDYLNSN